MTCLCPAKLPPALTPPGDDNVTLVGYMSKLSVNMCRAVYKEHFDISHAYFDKEMTE